MALASPLKHRTLSGHIHDELRQAILAGRYEGGVQLRQDALAETYGVSRIPVREALFQLEAEGLVRIVPQKGAVVSELSPAEIADVFDLRVLLEPRLFKASAPRLEEDDLARLDQLQAEYVTAIEAGAVQDYGRLNAELHMAIYGHADMPRTRQIVASLLQTSDRYTRLQLSTTEAMTTAMREHEALIGCCRAGEFARGATLLAEHIEAVRGDLLAVLEKKTG